MANQVYVAASAGKAPRHPPAQGVAKANIAFQKVEQHLALVVVLIPFLGVVAALVLLWRYGVGPVELALFVGMYVMGALGIEAGYHRLFSHRSFQAHPALRALLAIWGSMNAQGPVLFWAAIHRRHHSYADRPGDPHSPYLSADGKNHPGFWRGLWHAHTGWLFVHEITDWGRYAPDLLKDKVLFKINRYYLVWLSMGLIIPAALGGILTRTWLGVLSGFLWGGLVRIFIEQHVTWAVNSFCHVYGRRPFRIHDRSGNNGWLALLSVGASWHNNHHAFPTSTLTGLNWWQIDPTGWFIRGAKLLRLAWKLEIPSAQAVAAKMTDGVERAGD